MVLALDGAASGRFGSGRAWKSERAAEAAVPAERAVQLQPGSSKHRWRLYRALMYGPKDTTRAVQQLEAIAGLDSGTAKREELG